MDGECPLDLPHPLPASALEASIAIIGTTGGGKSYTARGVVERLLAAERRVCVLDPVGVWWGLKANEAGTGPGFKVAVIGGEYGDMPLAEGMGAPLARAIATNNLPTVVDTSEMGVGERNRFLLDFLSELYRVNRTALTLVLEEADEIAPQSPMPESRRLLDAVDKIARRGRARGFRIIMISQRPAVIHKNVLTQIRTMVAHRLTAPQDRKAVEDWIKGHGDSALGAEVIASLPKLATGEAWVWAPEQDILERSVMPRVTTLDSSRTPSADEEPLAPVSLAEIDLSPLREVIEAEVVDEDKPARPAKPDAAALKAEREAGYAAGFSDGVGEGAARERARILERLREIETDAAPRSGAGAEINAPRLAVKPDVVRPVAPSSDEAPSAALRMIATLDTNPPLRMSWNALAASVGNKARGGHFNAVRKWLRESGQIIEENGLVRITAPSDEATPPAAPEERARHLREAWKSILGGRPAQIIDLLAVCPMTKNEVADQLGCAASGGHWNAAWKALRDNEIVIEGAGVYRLSNELRGQDA